MTDSFAVLQGRATARSGYNSALVTYAFLFGGYISHHKTSGCKLEIVQRVLSDKLFTLSKLTETVHFSGASFNAACYYVKALRMILINCELCLCIQRESLVIYY